MMTTGIMLYGIFESLLRQQILRVHKKKKTIFLNHMKWWMLTKLTVVIISQYIEVKSKNNLKI